MNTNKVLLAALVGGVVYFLLGWVVYGMLLMDTYKSFAGSATGVNKGDTDMVLWAIFVGNVIWALLFAVIFDRWAKISTLQAGAVAGAWMSFLFSLSFNLLSYGTTNIMTFTGVLVDPIVSAVMGAIVGGIIGWVLGYGKNG